MEALRAIKLFRQSGVFVGLLILMSACAQRAFFEPRSEIISTAESKGVSMKSVEEERSLFFAQEEMHRKRLSALVEKREEPEFRDANYRLGPADEIEINVFDVPELNVTTKIRQSGFVSLPLVGAVQAVGLTESEFVDELRTRLKTFVRDPQVSVFVTNYGSQKVAVMGAVRKPGTVALKKGANSVLEVIAQAGGVSERAGNYINFIPAELSGVTNVTASEIVGGVPSERAQLALPAAALTGKGVSREAMKDAGIEIYLDEVMGTSGGIPVEIPVRGGDMIIIPESGKVNVEGEVIKPGTYDLPQQMSLLSALASAGGITYGAKVDEVEVIRDVGGAQKARLVLDLRQIGTGEEKDVRLRNGDIIRVPSDSGRRLTQDTFDGLSRIINFGVGGSFSVGP